MRILHFYKTYITDSHGGVEQFISQLVNATHKHGIQNEVLSLSKVKGGATVELPTHLAHRAYLDFQLASTGFSWSAIGRFKELAAKADIIHYHFPWPFMDLVHFVSRVKKPTIVTYHSDIVRQKNLLKVYQPLMNAFLNRVDRIVATSPNYIQSSAVLAQYKEKTSVVPIGLDEKSYQGESKSEKKWPQPFFLFVGVLRYYKGLHYLLQALEGLDYPLLIVGSGPEEQALKQQAQQLGLKQVHFLGQLPDEEKVALLKACYGFVFPSHLRSEAFGISLLEAAMFSKPMISCEIQTGTSYINQHLETGYVVPPNDSAALKQALQMLWNQPKLAQQFGLAARLRYEQLFTAEQMANGYINNYEDLLNRVPFSG